jgi:hypothetical protein
VKEKTDFSGELITRTITGHSPLSDVGGDFATVQADFHLSTADYLRLKDDRNLLSTWSVNLFFAFFGYFLSISPKFISQLSGGKESLANNEWWVLGIGVLVCLAMWGVGLRLPSEKKKVMELMGHHFANSPKSRQKIGGEK